MVEKRRCLKVALVWMMMMMRRMVDGEQEAEGRERTRGTSMRRREKQRRRSMERRRRSKDFPGGGRTSPEEGEEGSATGGCTSRSSSGV